MTETTFTLNDRVVTADIAPRMHLADFCREHEGLTGTHLGCEHGVCGACTVEIDGQIARSCIAFAAACDGAIIRTIEGFADDPLMARLRTAFSNHHALQCGYCTPGMLIAARDYIRRVGNDDDSAIRVAMSGNLCRCTGYAGIVEAIKSVIRQGNVHAEEQNSLEEASLGPVGSFRSAAAKDRPAVTNAKAASAMPRVPSVKRRGASIAVATSAFRNIDGFTHFDQNFTLPYPAGQVWSAMGNLETLVSCLPGAGLRGPAHADGAFQGSITVAFGPIARSFNGAGRFIASDDELSARIEGAGREDRGSSSANGSMRFELLDESGAATQVKTAVAYRLTGPLAQFGQANLVRAMVTEIGSMFAENLNAILSGSQPLATARRISVFGIGVGVIRAWFSQLFSRRAQ